MGDPHILTVDEILAADDLKEEVVPCPEWGGAVKVKGLTKAQIQKASNDCTTVDKRTGKATVLRRGGSGGGHDDAIVATRLGASSAAACRNAGTGAVTERARDARDHDGAREDHHGQHDRGGRHDHDRGDDNPGR